jgi:beta-lactamase class A
MLPDSREHRQKEGILMTNSITRRTALAGSLLVVPAFAALTATDAQGATTPEATDRFEDLERRHGGRLGVAILDLETGNRMEHRAHERFAMCSTFKFLAAAFVLARVDRREERLDRRVRFTEADLVTRAGRMTWSPVTRTRVGGDGMTISEVCEAAVALSDNTAGNLLLKSFGGPAALTTYLRSLGDPITRLDRFEPDLNEATPGDPRDTTTPVAMLENMRKLVLGDALSSASRKHLAAWLVATTTGDKRLRAGFPKGWRIGDKTGTGTNGVANDIAVVWPPNRRPVIVTVYSAEAKASDEQRDAIIAEVGRIAGA